MKILVCSSEYPPFGSGIANVAYNVVEQLRKKGIECTICSPTGPDIRLGSRELISNFGFLGLLYYWYQVSQFFNKKNAYDVVWLHNPYFIFFNPFPRCLITVHTTYYGMAHNDVGNTVFIRSYNKIISILERYCLRKICKTTEFTGVSQSVCEELEFVGIPKECISYIPNGVDIKKFHPSENIKELRNKFGIPDDEIVLLSIGRLTPQKQPLILVDCFSIIENRIGNVVLYISGKGELFNSTNDYVKKRNVHKIHFLGYINEDDIPDLYACCDYYIMTSKYEGLPLTLLEAMASGLPCIVSAIPQLEIVRDANCGIIVHFEDVEKASDQIYTYLTGIHQDHSNNARNFAVDKLNWEIIAQKYYDFFGNCVKSSSEK
jgi:1,2-diacylglycerol 3-alpha-glucosyltransferase